MTDAAKPQNPTAEAPKPMPFAIMRNAHEALRASIAVQEQLLAAGNVEEFKEEWRRFHKGLAVHMAMEDRSMFALLDEVGGGAVRDAALPGEHLEDARLASDVEVALNVDLARIRAAWNVWRADHLHHLEHEEQIMMPLTMKTGPTPEARARVVHERLLRPSESLPNFDWYIGWVISMLSRHGSAGNPPNVAVRVFAWGLQHACTPEQWNRYRPIVQRSCSPEIWQELSTKFGLDGEGRLV